MKQILQNIRNGETSIVEVPVATVHPGGLLIRTRASLISAGTERMLVDFGRAGLISKVRQQPDKVRMVLDKVRTDGVLPTMAAVRSKLDDPLRLGYSNVGIVLGVADGVTQFAVGDRVVSNGSHAEIVTVSRNLCARVPAAISDEQASFTVVGAIALQGVRLARPTLGECFVVIGLGLIGLMAVQLLRANGCRVLGIDTDAARTAMARRFGAETVELSENEDPLAIAESFSRGQGVDGVLLTLASESSTVVSQAAQMCRKRGRIVLVGVTGLELNRADFYEKELSFQVSCSYGPGRYDANYEQRGHDYPIGFVRWTEHRNFEAILDMMAAGALDVGSLITHRFAFERATEAYDLLSARTEACLGIVLTYGADALPSDRTVVLAAASTASSKSPDGEATIAVIGAGNYAGRVLIPHLARTGARLHSLASDRGVAAAHFGRKFAFAVATTEARASIVDPRVNAVVIATRHDSHAYYVCEALAAGKHVFVEKPLALTQLELDQIESAWLASNRADSRPILMVGFNRRFAPHVAKMKSLLAAIRAPKTIVITVNAGEIPPNHWTQDVSIGGGRIVGEACHFVDLMRHLVGHPVVRTNVQTIGRSVGLGVHDDKASITLAFDDGSFGTIHYLANGAQSFPKERIEVFAAGRVLQLDNFRKLRGWNWPGFSRMSLWRQDKGQSACVQAFVDAVRSGLPAPISFQELIEVSRVTLELAEAAR